MKRHWLSIGASATPRYCDSRSNAAIIWRQEGRPERARRPRREREAPSGGRRASALCTSRGLSPRLSAKRAMRGRRMDLVYGSTGNTPRRVQIGSNRHSTASVSSKLICEPGRLADSGISRGRAVTMRSTRRWHEEALALYLRHRRRPRDCHFSVEHGHHLATGRASGACEATPRRRREALRDGRRPAEPRESPGPARRPCPRRGQSDGGGCIVRRRPRARARARGRAHRIIHPQLPRAVCP